VHVIADDRNKRGSRTSDRETVELSEFQSVLIAKAVQTGADCLAGGGFMSLGTIILIILVIALLGGFSGVGGGPFYGTGYYGGGGLGLVIVILLILLLLGRL
jgi:hypothetical protein